MPSSTEQTPLLRNRFNAISRGLRKVDRKNSTRNERVADLIEKQRQKAQANHDDAQAERLADVLNDIREDQKRDARQSGFTIFLIIQHIVGGAFTLWFLEGWSLYDCFYFCIVTTTTVGYGDLTPETNLAKAFVIYYVIAAVGIISAILANLIQLLLDQQEEFLLTNIVDDEEYDNDQDLEAGDSQSSILESTKKLDFEDYVGIMYGVALVAGIIVTGVVVFMKLEHLSFIDALYTTVISATTVGFGDFGPKRNASKVFFTIWLCIATIGVAKLVADFTDAHVKMKQRSITRRLLTCNLQQEGFRALDKNKDGKIEKYEFLTEMLISTGKVEREEVESILTRFNQLDADKDGVLEIKDLGE